MKETVRKSSQIVRDMERPLSKAALFRQAGLKATRAARVDANLVGLGKPVERARSAPIPAQHMATANAFVPSTVKKTPTPNREAINKRSKFREPDDQSHLARDRDNRTCKMRPEKLEPRRAGGGASKKYVPWCKD